MSFYTAQLLNLRHRQLCIFVRRRRDGKCNQNFVRMKTWILAAQIVRLEALNRLNRLGRYEMQLVFDTAKHLQ